jgi:HEAT repeats
MERILIALTLATLTLGASPAQAQWFFGRRTKVNPSQRVPELILIVKTDPDDRKRAHAAEELRGYDAKVYTEIVPVLADVLLHDKKMSVRSEALGSLARIRPVNSFAGQAMEKAAAADESWRVRWQARAALAKYHLAGYSSRKSAPASTTSRKQTTVEPPLAEPPGPLPLPTSRYEAPPRPLPLNVVPAPQGPPLFP